MDLISVIVPVYKVEKYLDKCVQSIVDQTYKNLEIILVDDGSPDDSGKICDVWAQKDSRVKVIHQQNAGGGAARNAALDAAAGNLLAFVDSDDYLAPDMFEYLHSLIMQGADIAECGHTDVYDDNAIFSATDDNVRTFTREEAMAEHIRDQIFRQLIWNKLYRREVVGSVRFPVGKKIDDEFFTYQVLGNANVLVRSEKIGYAYRQQASSVMHSMGARNRMQAVEAKLQRHAYIERQFPALKELSLKNLWFTCVYQGQISLLEMEKEEAKEVILQLKKVLNEYPCHFSNCNFKEKIWLTLARTFLKFTCKMRNYLNIGY